MEDGWNDHGHELTLDPSTLEELREYKHSNLSVPEIMDIYLSSGGRGPANKRIGQREMRHLLDYRRTHMDNTVHPERPMHFLVQDTDQSEISRQRS